MGRKWCPYFYDGPEAWANVGACEVLLCRFHIFIFITDNSILIKSMRNSFTVVPPVYKDRYYLSPLQQCSDWCTITQASSRSYQPTPNEEQQNKSGSTKLNQGVVLSTKYSISAPPCSPPSLSIVHVYVYVYVYYLCTYGCVHGIPDRFEVSRQHFFATSNSRQSWGKKSERSVTWLLGRPAPNLPK